MTTHDSINFALSPDDAQRMANEAIAPILTTLTSFRTGLLEAGISAAVADRMCEQLFATMVTSMNRTSG